ncbi:MAG: DUF2061 domain-containing protein [Bdellovibrionales bacterium]
MGSEKNLNCPLPTFPDVEWNGWMRETHWRSLVKGVSWRLAGTLATIGISWIFTHDLEISLSIGGLELLTKLGLYYTHERIWLKISWGRRHP